MTKTIAGLYNSFADARNVRDALVEVGFDKDDISILAANSEKRYQEFVDRNIDESDYDRYYVTETERSHSAEGAVAGGLIGGAGAAILAVVVPGVGPFTATGWLLAGLVGVAGGAITGGILGALVDAGIDEDDATLYSEAVRRGYALLTVRADDNDAWQVAAIMEDYNAIDTDERAAYWESHGWERTYDATDPVYNLQQIEAERAGYRTYSSDSASMLNNGTETTYADYLPYYEYGRRLGSRDNAVTDWGVAEADVRRDWEREYGNEDTLWEDIKDTVRSGWESVKDAFSGDDEAYRRHFAQNHGSNGYTYDYYAPHYHYGYRVSSNPAYTSGSDWDMVEPQIRKDWEREYNDENVMWDDVKFAVHTGWRGL